MDWQADLARREAEYDEDEPPPVYAVPPWHAWPLALVGWVILALVALGVVALFRLLVP